MLQQLHVVAINKTKTKYTSTNKARTNEYDCNLSQKKADMDNCNNIKSKLNKIKQNNGNKSKPNNENIALVLTNGQRLR